MGTNHTGCVTPQKRIKVAKQAAAIRAEAPALPGGVPGGLAVGRHAAMPEQKRLNRVYPSESPG